MCLDLVAADAQELLFDAVGHLGPFTEGLRVPNKRPGRKASKKGKPGRRQAKGRAVAKTARREAATGSTALPLQVMPAACLLHW